MGERVLVAAGRRVDTDGAFPVARVPIVRDAIERLIARVEPRSVIASAACGGDLLVLDAARRAGIALHVVLPFEPELFKLKSVADRPEHPQAPWSRWFDEIQQRGHIVILHTGGHDPFQCVTEELLEEASRRSSAPSSVTAAVIWEGHARDTRESPDYTEAFRRGAIARKFDLAEILTI